MARRKDGYIEKTVTINGRRVHVYGKNDREIHDKVDQLYDEQYHGITSDMPFKKYAAHWLDVTLPGKALNTCMSYKKCVNQICRDIGDYPIGYMKRSEIEKALNQHKDTPSTRNKMLSLLKSIYNLAVDDGICQFNPCTNIKNIPEKPNHRDRFTKEEINAIKKADLPPTERLFVDILYHTGLRKGEALGLSRRSIGNGVIHITEQSVWDSSGKAVIAPLKTFNASRDIPIPSELEKQIRAYMKATPSIYLFESIRSRHAFSYSWFDVRVAIYKVDHPNFTDKNRRHRVRHSLVPCKITPHMFRHNYASILYDNHIDPKVAQKLLGHASIKTTIGIYTHLSKESVQDAYDVVRGISAVM